MTTRTPQPPARVEDRFLTVGEVMDRLNYGRHKVYDLIRGGDLPSVKDGKYRRIRESALDRFMADRESVA